MISVLSCITPIARIFAFDPYFEIRNEMKRRKYEKVRERERKKEIDLSVFNTTTRFFAAPTTGNQDTRDSLVKRETRENILPPSLPLSLYSPECLHSRMGVGYDRMDDRRGGKKIKRASKGKKKAGGRRASLSDCRK